MFTYYRGCNDIPKMGLLQSVQVQLRCHKMRCLIRVGNLNITKKKKKIIFNFSFIETLFQLLKAFFSPNYTPLQTLFVVGILFSRCPSVCVCLCPSACNVLCVCPSVTFCFLNNSKSQSWIFIKPCKHVHICKTNTLDKKVRARGQFYKSYFPL